MFVPSRLDWLFTGTLVLASARISMSIWRGQACRVLRAGADQERILKEKEDALRAREQALSARDAEVEALRLQVAAFQARRALRHSQTCARLIF